jgi:hypothetical protein
MKSVLFWLSERLSSLSLQMEDWADFLREKSRSEDLEIPFYPEGPEGDQ